MIEGMALPRITPARLAGVLLIIAGIGFVLVDSVPGYFTGICGICASYPLYDIVVGNILGAAYVGFAVAAFIAGIIALSSSEYVKLLAWSAYIAGLTLVFLTGYLAGYSLRDELVPEPAPVAAFIGSSLLAVSIPLAIMWRRRLFSALAAIGSAAVAAVAYPPVVNKIPFHPSATNLSQAAMELAIITHPLVMAMLAVFAASAALGAPRRLVTGLAAAPLLAVAYASYHVAEVIASSTRWVSPSGTFIQSGLYIIADTAVAGAVMLVAMAAFSTYPGSN